MSRFEKYLKNEGSYTCQKIKKWGKIEEREKRKEREQEQAAGSADTGHSVLSATNVGSTSPSKKAKIEHVETIPIHSDDEDMDIPDAQD